MKNIDTSRAAPKSWFGFRLPAPVLMFAAVSLLNEVSAQMVAPLIPILLVAVLSAGPVALGVVEGTADAFASLVTLYSGRLADFRPRHRKAMVLAGYALAVLSRPLMAFAGSWFAVVVLRSLDRVGKGIRGAPRDAILADAMPADMRGRGYGLNRAMDYAGAVVGTLIAAAVLAWSALGIENIIALSIVPGVIVLGFLFLLPSSVSYPASGTPPQFSRSDRSWRGLSPVLRRYLMTLVIFAFARTSEAFIVLRGHELGMSTLSLLLLWAYLTALQSVTALIGAPISDRIAKRTLTLFNWTGLAIGYFALAGAASPLWLWVAVSLYGMLSGIGEGVERAFVSELALAGQAGTAFGWYHLTNGLSAIPAGVVFGLVWKVYSPSVAFGVAAGMAILAAVFLACFVPAKAPAPLYYS